MPVQKTGHGPSPRQRSPLSDTQKPTCRPRRTRSSFGPQGTAEQSCSSERLRRETPWHCEGRRAPGGQLCLDPGHIARRTDTSLGNLDALVTPFDDEFSCLPDE